MNTEISKKITAIETLYTEQEYTIATLNEIVTRQDCEITNLRNDLQWLKQQLQSLKEQVPDGGSSETHELPPHY